MGGSSIAIQDRKSRRARGAPLSRPVSASIYRAGLVLVAVSALVVALSLPPPEPLPRANLPPSFDQAIAHGFAVDFARRFPDRSPATPASAEAAGWVAERLRDYGLDVEEDRFTAEVAGVGRRELVNVVATAPGRSPEAIVVLAHRDNSGRSPGADDNASGTGVLLELARTAAVSSPAHTFVFLSSDGGVYGGAGAERFASSSEPSERAAAVVNLDALAGPGGPGLQFAGAAPQLPAPALVATADARVRDETGAAAARPALPAQLLDLAFPLTLYDHGPLVAAGIPAVTLTTGGARPREPEGDTVAAMNRRRMGELGRAATALVASLDESAEVAQGTDSYLYAGSRLVRGWTLQLALLAALLPFLAAVADLLVRARRRGVALAPALRSLRSRLGVWLWAGVLFAAGAALGFFPRGDDRPLSPDGPAGTDWPEAALLALVALALLGWLVTRPRLARRGPVERRDELAGHLVAMLALGVVAVAVAGANPYALVFLLPSLHAWLWLPNASERGVAWRGLLFGLGLLGPALLLGSLAFRFDLGFDAPWYAAALVSVGYIPLALVAALLVWTAAAAQVAALAFGRYAPYPRREERPARGPIRELIRAAVLLVRGRKRTRRAAATRGERALDE